MDPAAIDAVPDADPLVERYLEHVRVEKRLAQRTVELYALDLQKLQSNALQASVVLTAVHNTHVRRWVAQMHSGGRSARGIALILSGWRGFYTWLGREGLVGSNPVQDVRSPKAAKPLPKALSVDEAVQLAKELSTDDSPAFVNGVLGQVMLVTPQIRAAAAAVRSSAAGAPENEERQA